MSISIIVKTLALQYQDSLTPYSPFPVCEDRDRWEQIDVTLRKQLLEEGIRTLGQTYPAIQASDFMAFTLTGNRSDYEKRYFERRHMLSRLVLAECIENKGTFLPKIIDGIWLLCEESSWVLPAHNSYIRDTPQLILPDTSKPVLDLFACETGALLSMVRYLLRTQLDRISPLICERIDRILQSHILTPYIREHFWWMGNEEEPMCNWTPWCTQNILLTAFLSGQPQLSASDKRCILEKAAYSLDCFLKDYGEDGCCEEGAQYFRHAGLCLFACLDIMNAVTNNHFKSLYQDAKMKNIAAYIYHVHADGPYYFNFADCSPLAGRSGAREYLFGKATDQTFLVNYASQDFADSYADGTLLTDESQTLNLYFRTQSICMAGEILQYQKNTVLQGEKITSPNTVFLSDMYYQSVGVWITRSANFCLAVKSGNNGDSHNHNDTGSFILYKNGKPLFVDIGVETYTRKTFSPDRYEIWTMQSCYHNLPVIDGRDQSAGAQYGASDVTISDADQLSQIEMDLSTAYEETNRPYIRKIGLNKAAEEVTITDSSSHASVVLNFITYDMPVISDNSDGTGTIKIGEALAVYEGASSPEIDTLPITDERLMKAWDHDLYRIRMKLRSDRFLMNIR